MRVICPHCQNKAIISSSSKLSDTVTDLYCSCSNVADCGASFVFTLAYKHVLSPPHKSVKELAAALLIQLPAEERKELMQGDLFG